MMKPRSDEKLDILETNKFNFPISHLDRKDEYLEDILKAITIQSKEIQADMHMYEKEFPYKVIPHIKGTSEIIDIIHHYKRPVVNQPKK